MEDDRRSLAVSRSELAGCEMDLRRWDEARAQLDKAIRLHQEMGASYDKALLAQAHLQRGQVALETRETAFARDDFDHALALGRSSVWEAGIGDQYTRWVLAQALLAAAPFQDPREEAREIQVAWETGEHLLEGDPQAKRYALVLLEVLARQAALTQTPEASQLRTERCVRARGFRAEDPEDIRFVLEDCPQERRPQGETP